MCWNKGRKVLGGINEFTMKISFIIRLNTMGVGYICYWCHFKCYGIVGSCLHNFAWYFKRGFMIIWFYALNRKNLLVVIFVSFRWRSNQLLIYAIVSFWSVPVNFVRVFLWHSGKYTYLINQWHCVHSLFHVGDVILKTVCYYYYCFYWLCCAGVLHESECYSF